ncbi:hypothetical protein GCE86_18780 [Micromonospora terminaliae]|uniref:DUF4386 family protein n=1 Tax=Micromonospora terminaliae TaxID=1914461 RepID=A0AAJ3DK96_9ACTN|nr:hypothetical protein [Micromonospora terminaliae]NES29118.1 hypothetical protein [Micromonospora terminaliae]QGL48881.1 hypothetical protein GCE86_18780 [Micromonospora terminaliae]
MDDSTGGRTGRRLTAGALLGGGVAYGVANAFYWMVFPDDVADTAGNVAVAAGNLGAWRVETVLFALAHLLLLPATLGLAATLHGRKPVAALIGGATALLGLYFSTVHLWQYNAFFGALAGGGVDADAARPVTTAIDGDPFVMASFAVWLLGWLVGLLVLAFGAWRARLVALWVPLLLTAGQVLDLVGSGVAVKLAVSVLMVAGFVGLALGVARRHAVEAPAGTATPATATA